MEEGTEDERGDASKADKGKPQTKGTDVESTAEGREKAEDVVKVEKVRADGDEGKTREKKSSPKCRAKASKKKEEEVEEKKQVKEERDKQPAKEPAAKAPISSFFSESKIGRAHV